MALWESPWSCSPVLPPASLCRGVLYNTGMWWVEQVFSSWCDRARLGASELDLYQGEALGSVSEQG